MNQIQIKLGILIEIFYYSEVWILLLPLILIYYKKIQPAYFKPVTFYLWMALIFNTLSFAVDIFFDVLPVYFRSNTVIYNLHSLVRFFLFSWFFLSIRPQYYKQVNRLIIVAFLLIFSFYFSFVDNFFNKDYISADMMSGESFFLLCLSIIYYLSILHGDNPKFTDRKDFWIVTGLAIFCVINFFIFLFYMPLLDESIKVAINIWDVYKVAFITFILFITKAIYVPYTDKH